MFSLFKKPQIPTCKKCGLVAVGLNAAGLCSTCGKDNTVNASLDNYEALKAGICCVCWDKTASVDDYDLCDKCKSQTVISSPAIYHIAQLFKLRHTEDIKTYEDVIVTAFDNDKDSIPTIANEYKNFCLSFGTAGLIYLEKQKADLQKRTYNPNTVGYALQMAFDSIDT